MKAQQIIPLATLALSLLCVEDSEGASFTPLGFNTAEGLSDNGVFVLSSSAVRWSAASGVQELGSLSGASGSLAFAMSADGEVIVGVSGGRAFRWTAQSGMADLGMLLGKTYHVAWGVSGDGSVVVGSGDIGGNERFVEPFRWTANGGMVGLGFLPGASRGEALAISRDGRVIVGYSGNDDVQAFRRGSDGIMRGLGFLPGYVTSIAQGVSSNGSVIVGDCLDASGNSQAFRWTEAGGIQGLGVLAGYNESSTKAVSGDGGVVVGYVKDVSSFNSQTGEYRSRAFIWDAVHGMRELQPVLTSQFGLNLTAWILQDATAITADGTAIAGFGTNPQGKREAWMVKLTATQPTLSIRRFSTSVEVSWPVAFSNLVLQSRRSFAPADVWSPVTNAPIFSTGELVVTNSVVGGARFFRLKSP